jgi:hypothetical protein
MLPLECHYVAEIRYQEHVAGARPPLRAQLLSKRPSRWLPSWRPSVLTALRTRLIARQIAGSKA